MISVKLPIMGTLNVDTNTFTPAEKIEVVTLNIRDTVNAQTIAPEFTRILKDWLRVDEWDAMCALNATEKYQHGACASQNYCDANMAMIEAFDLHKVAHPSDDHPDSITLWNEAWELARSTWQPWPPAQPWQACFRKFDYDYLALIAELGCHFEDSTWQNDSCPSANGTREFLGVKIWFDHADPDASENAEDRHEGWMKRFSLTLDGIGDTILHTDDWSELKAFITGGDLAKWMAANPAKVKEAKDYCS